MRSTPAADIASALMASALRARCQSGQHSEWSQACVPGSVPKGRTTALDNSASPHHAQRPGGDGAGSPVLPRGQPWPPGPGYAAGTLLASSSDDSTIKLWRTTDWTIVRELTGHRSGVYQISFSPDGRFLLSTSDDKTARLWGVASGKELIKPIQHDWPVWTADFSPDGKMIATGSEDSLIRFWHISTEGTKPTLQRSTTLRISDGPVWWITFKQSAEGLLLAFAGQDRLIRVLNITTFDGLSAGPDKLKYEAEQRGGLVVRMNGTEPEIVPILADEFRQLRN
jgi:hypothetical protein